ncbi:hypothetical protein BRC96_11405 [Halobacteriales archaeon QS_6_64_34]|nr:MAG: hypothetical protein BRC96_11405 [Halobacteriales archaeon QS_6_64_34]
MTGSISGEDTRSVDAYGLLNHPLRHRVLLELPNHDNPVRLPVLADSIRSSEIGGNATPHDDTADSEAMRIELHHNHLPKLAAAGWVEYDSETRTIRYESRIETIQSALRTAADGLDQVRAAYDERTAGLDSRQE